MIKARRHSRRDEDAQVKAGELKITPLKAITPEATSHAPAREGEAASSKRSWQLVEVGGPVRPRD